MAHPARVGHCVYRCSLEPNPSPTEERLGRVRRYREIEGGLHQQRDVSGGADSSRVHHRNALFVPVILPHCSMGLSYDWRRKRRSLRQSTLKDSRDAMNRFNHCLAFASATPRLP